jgi:hypothetical protein
MARGAGSLGGVDVVDRGDRGDSGVVAGHHRIPSSSSTAAAS